MSCNICILTSYDLFNLPSKRADFNHLPQLIDALKHAMEKWFKSAMLRSSNVPHRLVRASIWSFTGGFCSLLISWRLLITEIIHRSKVAKWQFQKEEKEFFSVMGIGECYLTSRYPPVLLNNVGHRLQTAMCWFVMWTDKLNSSVQACLAGSLHDYMTLLQVHNSFLIFKMGVSYSLSSNA